MSKFRYTGTDFQFTNKEDCTDHIDKTNEGCTKSLTDIDH